MNDINETIGTENKFVENSFGIQSLLCLASNDNAEGLPISSTESLRRHLPFRLFGVIEMIEENSTNFAISLLNDPRDMRSFKYLLSNYYSDPANRTEVEKENIEVNGLYVCRLGKQFFRCVLKNIDKKTYTVYLVDVGRMQTVYFDELFVIMYEFYDDTNKYAYALRCSTPEPDYLSTLQLPALNDFCVGDVIDVVVCSLHEPCLAIIASTNRHFSRLHPAFFTHGLDELTVTIWQSNFLNSLPSFEGITVGQYPSAQPTISDEWVLATIAAFNSLDNIFVRDIPSSIRLSILQDILNDFYSAKVCRFRMAFPDDVCLASNLPCVIFDSISNNYLRAKIVCLSGDRTVANLVSVDYPSIVFKDVERTDLFMLSEKFFVPPQCFSIQLVSLENDNELHHYTLLAKHFLEVGSVVAISLLSKSTIATLKIDNSEDILQKIGFLSKKRSNNHKNSLSPDSYYSINSNAFLSSFRRVSENVLSKENVQLPPVKNVMLSNYGLPPPGATKKPILKNLAFSLNDNSTKIPINAFEVFISKIRNMNAIYYRTRELANNFSIIQKMIKDIPPEELMLVNSNKLSKVKVGQIYLICPSIDTELYRVKILSVETKDDSIKIFYDRIDDGDHSELFEKSDKLYFAPNLIEKFSAPTVYGPCRLSRTSADFISNEELEDSVGRVRFIFQLRVLIQNHKRCMAFVEATKDIELYQMNGTSINKEFFTSLRKILDSENILKENT